MESTSVYWKPIFYVLEGRLECWLLNAQHMRNVPGRKTDVADSTWICQLIEHGLVRPSFVPPQPIRELRDLTRYRKAQIEDRTRVVQRLDKVLQDAGIKLTSVASKTLGVSARLMLDALVAGTHDPDVLADLAKGKLRAKLPELKEALEGRFRTEHHGLLVGHILAHIDYLDETIATLSSRIEEVIAPFSKQVEGLDTIPGVNRRTAQVIIAEIGVDMAQFPSAGHLASWAGVCPGNNESAGKRKTGKTRPGPKWLRKGLTEAAKARPEARARTWGPSTPGSSVGGDQPRPRAQPAIPSSSPRTTSFAMASPITSSAPTTSTVGSRPNDTSSGLFTSSSSWDRRSSSNQPPDPKGGHQAYFHPRRKGTGMVGPT